MQVLKYLLKLHYFNKSYFKIFKKKLLNVYTQCLLVNGVATVYTVVHTWTWKLGPLISVKGTPALDITFIHYYYYRTAPWESSASTKNTQRSISLTSSVKTR